MVRSEFSRVVQRVCHLRSRKAALLLIDGFIESIIEVLKSGENLKLNKLGKFTVKLHESFETRDPKTGNKIMSKPKRLVKFSVCKYLKRVVNEAMIENANSSNKDNNV